MPVSSFGIGRMEISFNIPGPERVSPPSSLLNSFRGVCPGRRRLLPAVMTLRILERGDQTGPVRLEGAAVRPDFFLQNRLILIMHASSYANSSSKAPVSPAWNLCHLNPYIVLWKQISQCRSPPPNYYAVNVLYASLILDERVRNDICTTE